MEEEYLVPCGKCHKCRRTRINQWVFRLQQHEKDASSSYFITLTYDTDNLPISKNGYMILEKPDLQKFFKRLRYHDRESRKEHGNYKTYKEIPDYQPIRYYACGEYGDEKSRPHYHAIVFDVYDEDSIFKAWKKGKVHIGTVTEESIAYTCKYIDKEGNQKIPAWYLDNDDRIKPFSLMSKKLGFNYVQKISKTYHKSDLTRNFVRTGKGYKVSIPRYFAKHIFTEEENIRRRELAAESAQESNRRKAAEYRHLFQNFTAEEGRIAENEMYFRHIKKTKGSQ